MKRSIETDELYEKAKEQVELSEKREKDIKNEIIQLKEKIKKAEKELDHARRETYIKTTEWQKVVCASTEFPIYYGYVDHLGGCDGWPHPSQKQQYEHILDYIKEGYVVLIPSDYIANKGIMMKKPIVVPFINEDPSSYSHALYTDQNSHLHLIKIDKTGIHHLGKYVRYEDYYG